MKKTISIITLIIAAVLLWFLVLPKIKVTRTTDHWDQTNPLTMLNSNSLDLTAPFSNDPRDGAWVLFQKYLEFNKTQDLNGVKSAVYKISAVCEDPKTLIDCQARMGAAYKYGSTLKKADFTNFWSDERQAILSTDFKFNEDDSVMGRNRGIIFFVKDEAGNLKLLSLSPFKGATVNKGSASEQELRDRLLTYTDDNDNDGISDYDEECVGAAATGRACEKTSPLSRDTDGDGLWDGIEALMK